MTRAARPTRVAFLPMLGSINPYQSLLARALTEHGAEVTPLPGRAFAGALRALRLWRADVLHLHWLPPVTLARTAPVSLIRILLFLLELRVHRLRGLRIVWTVHNHRSHGGVQLRLDQWCRRGVARIAHALIVHSEAAKRRVVSTFRIREAGKVVVIPHGDFGGCYADAVNQKTARARLGIAAGTFVLLFFGLIRPYKGMGRLIDAFRTWGESGTLLLIAGDQRSGRPLGELIEGLDGARYDAGFVPDSRVQLYMRASDVAVLPHYDILTSGSAVLASAFARACIAPDVDCMRDVLHPEGAFFYDPGRPEALLGAMREAYRCRDALGAMGERNQGHAAKWPWSEVARRTAAVYKSESNTIRDLSAAGHDSAAK